MEKVNLIPILENCPKGMELDCTLFHDVRFDYIDKENNNYPIRCFIETKDGNNTISLNKYGEYHINSKSKCVIFPKGKTSWKEFVIPFKVGDWIYHDKSGNAFHINKIENDLYISDDFATISLGRQNDWRLWTIQDAKDGDVLAWDDSNCIAIFSKIENDESFISHGFIGNITEVFEKGYGSHSITNHLHPATKEQHELLFQKMHEAGYEWDAEKKELKKIKQVELPNGEDYGIDSLYHAASILEKTLGGVEGYQSDDGILEHKCAIEAVKRLYNQKSAWSEDDEKILYQVQDHLREYYVDKKGYPYVAEPNSNEMIEYNWLKSLKERMKGE